MNILLCFVVSGCSLLFHNKGVALNYLYTNLYLHLHWPGQFVQRVSEISGWSPPCRLSLSHHRFFFCLLCWWVKAMKFELRANFPWAWQHKGSNMGSGWLLGTNYMSVQCFPPLSSLANNLLLCTEFLSSHQPMSFQLLSFLLSAMSCWSHTEASQFSLAELCCNPKTAPLWPPWAHPEVAHTGWKEFILLVEVMWPQSQDEAICPGVTSPVQGMLSTGQSSRLGDCEHSPNSAFGFFGRIWGKMILNCIFHLLKDRWRYFPRGVRC